MENNEKDLLLKCTDVSFSYDGVTVAENINFEVYKGDYLCIVGENGAGKTTLMKGILGLKKTDGGSIEFCNGLKQTEIGYLPQQTVIQKDFPASVYEVVLSGRLNKKKFLSFYTHEDRKVAKKNMKRLGISDLKNRCFKELSGGQQQRVLLARALCATEKVLLLDEPVTGLDPSAVNEMYELIAHINRDYDITVIMISHDIYGTQEYSNKILHVNKQQQFFGTTEDYLKSKVSDEFFN